MGGKATDSNVRKKRQTPKNVSQKDSATSKDIIKNPKAGDSKRKNNIKKEKKGRIKVRLVIGRIIKAFWDSAIVDGFLYSNGILTCLLWNPERKKFPFIRFLLRLLYICTPFALVMLFAFSAYNDDVFSADSQNEKFISFWADRTTSFTFGFLLFFMFFINGIYVYHFNKSVTSRQIAKVTGSISLKKTNTIFAIFRVIWNVVAIIVSGKVLSFINAAKERGAENYWYTKMKAPQYNLYRFIIILTCYCVVRVCGLIIINAIHIFILTSREVCSGESDNLQNEIKPMRELYNYLSIALGIGVSCLITLGMMLYSDFYVQKNNVVFKLYDEKERFILLSLVGVVLFFGTIVLGYISIWDFIKRKGGDSVQSDDTKEKNRGTVWAFVLTAFLPGIAALVQILDPISKIFEGH